MTNILLSFVFEKRTVKKRKKIIIIIISDLGLNNKTIIILTA